MNHLLPIFMKLENQPCLVVGGGKVAFQKIKQLLDSKAEVTVVALKVRENIQAMPVYINYSEYRENDVKGYQLVIAATDDESTNRRIYEDAQKLGIPINVVDQPELCSFYMGSVYQDGDVKVAVSTNGRCPSFGKYLRDHIKNMSKGLWGKTLEQLALKREKIVKKLISYSQKQKLLEKLVNNNSNSIIGKLPSKGKVFIVGAGPGDPELITVKGLRAIQKADVILHDALIHPHLVFEINPVAEKIFVGKREGRHSVNQKTIHRIMVEEAGKGRQVVRLKGGDPFIFGRGGEEAEALAKEGIPFEVIAGVTAGIGAAAGFGIPLTYRNQASSTLLVTGHQCEIGGSQNWTALATLDSTLVFYMGLKKIKEIVRGLVENGKPLNTPLAIIQNATMVNQEIMTSTLAGIEADLRLKKPKTPAIIIIGEVVNHYAKLENYLENLPASLVEPIGDLGFDFWKNEVVLA